MVTSEVSFQSQRNKQVAETIFTFIEHAEITVPSKKEMMAATLKDS